MKSLRFGTPAVAAALALIASSPAGAVSPKYWIHDTAEDFLGGEAQGVSVTSDGSLVLGPEVRRLAEPDVAYIWDVAAGDAGTFLATGDDGWVIRVRGDELQPFFQCAALEVLSLLLASDGTLWAGTAPEGFVYRIDPETGEGSIAFDAEEPYVWDLAEGPDGRIWAALGGGARVVRIDPGSNEAETVAEIDDNHVVCLDFDAEGGLLLGTEGKGLVARIAPDGGLRVLYDTPQGEVASVLAGEGGEVWAAASSTTESREEANEATPDSNSDGSGIENSMDFAFEFLPPDAGDGVLYRIDPQGNPTRVWESGMPIIYDLAWANGGGAVLAATGEEGHLYSVEPDGKVTLVLDAEEDHVVHLERRGEVTLLATANPARLLEIRAGYGSEGMYESQVLDARRPAKWGRAEWRGDGGGVKLSVRAGNTEEPDNTWGEWRSPGKDGALDLDGIRFLQWRLTLSGGGKSTPVVRRVRVSSLEHNLAPRISGVQVAPAGTGFYDDIPDPRPRPLYQALPGGVKVQYSFDQGENEFPPEARAPWTRGMRQIRWEAIDPNEDFLLYDLSYRRTDETEWKGFAEDVDGPNFAFNSQGVPDGIYLIRVTASDRRDNPAGEHTAHADSEPFIVDNTAPEIVDVKDSRSGDSVRVTAGLRDELSDVIRFEYAVDGEDWVDLGPVDGIFDSTTERVELEVEAPEGTEHTVLLRATDLGGNLGTARVLLRP
jgi:hypothetical protein